MENYVDWTKKQFEELPKIEFQGFTMKADRLILLPTEDMHESGYRMMDFIPIVADKPVGKISGCTDAVHIEYRPSVVIDCLPKSGLMQLIFNHRQVEISYPYSSLFIN